MTGDHGTRGPRDQRTRDHGTTDHGTKDQETRGPGAWPNLPKPNLGRTFQKKTRTRVRVTFNNNKGKSVRLALQAGGLATEPFAFALPLWFPCRIIPAAPVTPGPVAPPKKEALIIRLGFWGPLTIIIHKEPQNSSGSYLSPYSKPRPPPLNPNPLNPL